MDKTIQLVLVITVAMVTALIVIMMVTGQTGPFENFAKNTSQNSQCDLWIEQAQSDIGTNENVCEKLDNSDCEVPTGVCDG